MSESAASRFRREHNRQRGECTWCGGPVGPGRRTWCGDPCVSAWMASRGSWANLCWLVEQRDRGVCSLCGCDTRQLQALLRGWNRRNYEAWKDAVELLLCVGFPRYTCRTWWEADHIMPRAEGGEDCLENLRTLCVPCHKARTAAWHGERARRRALVRLRSRPHDHAGRIAGLLADMRQLRFSVIVEET